MSRMSVAYHKSIAESCQVPRRFPVRGKSHLDVRHDTGAVALLVQEEERLLHRSGCEARAFTTPSHEGRLLNHGLNRSRAALTRCPPSLRVPSSDGVSGQGAAQVQALGEAESQAGPGGAQESQVPRGERRRRPVPLTPGPDRSRQHLVARRLRSCTLAMSDALLNVSRPQLHLHRHRNCGPPHLSDVRVV